MQITIIIILILIPLLFSTYAQELPTNYEYYTAGGIKSGLVAEGDYFTLNGKEIRIFSGSLHYFRVPRVYWKDRLLKMRAAGLNAVQFYSPWNLHEEIPDHFDFENDMLNLTEFLYEVKRADMFALHRPGPYICAEWEFGGLPAWLLRDPNMSVRSNYKPFVSSAVKYYAKIVNITKHFQFSTNGGPIIAMQIENEFWSFGDTDKNNEDFNYLTALKNASRDNGFKELLYTSDPWVATKGSLPDLYRTANGYEIIADVLTNLKKSQPNKPLYVAEFWSGWFDKWGDAYHHNRSAAQFAALYEEIIFKFNSSVNVYMFHGGTNFGLMNGDYYVTSYDFDAPISEAGNYTEKYWKAKEIIARFNNERNAPKIKISEPPNEVIARAYGIFHVPVYLSYDVLLTKLKQIESEIPAHMESLDIGSNYGQNFGFIVYRKKISKIKSINFTEGVSDRAFILIDNKLVHAMYQKPGQHKAIEVDVSNDDNFLASESEHTLDIIVECMGRAKIGKIMNEERMGVNGDVVIDGTAHYNWTILSLDFRKNFNFQELSDNKQLWTPFDSNVTKPALYMVNFEILDTPSDTFLKLDNWISGVVFVNGFNIGRYWNIGPQRTLYVAAPFLKTGNNTILIFELYGTEQQNSIEFVDKHLLY